MIGLFACAEPVGPAEKGSVTPEFGEWTVRFASTWEGDCALADPSTYEAAEQAWIVEDDRYGFAVRDEAGYRIACALDASDFVCALPVIADDFSSLGYDVRATYSPSWRGTFADPRSFEGTHEVAAECEGTDCDVLTGYGEDFTFPCTAVAPIEGAFEGA